jgi:hypothetical protein
MNMNKNKNKNYFLDKLICPPEESESYEQFEDTRG